MFLRGVQRSAKTGWSHDGDRAKKVHGTELLGEDDSTPVKVDQGQDSS